MKRFESTMNRDVIERMLGASFPSTLPAVMPIASTGWAKIYRLATPDGKSIEPDLYLVSAYDDKAELYAMEAGR